MNRVVRFVSIAVQLCSEFIVSCALPAFGQSLPRFQIYPTTNTVQLEASGGGKKDYVHIWFAFVVDRQQDKVWSCVVTADFEAGNNGGRCFLSDYALYVKNNGPSRLANAQFASGDGAPVADSGWTWDKWSPRPNLQDRTLLWIIDQNTGDLWACQNFFPIGKSCLGPIAKDTNSP